MWKKWTGLIWGIAIALPCSISLNMPLSYALQFGVAILVMAVIIPNVDLGMNRLIQAAFVGVLLSLPTSIAFGWWPLSAIAAACGVCLAWLHEHVSPRLSSLSRAKFPIPVFRLRSLFAITAFLALLFAWHHHSKVCRSYLGEEGIALYQRWYEIRPNRASIAVQTDGSGRYRINGQELDYQAAATYLIATLDRLRTAGIDESEFELQSTAKDPYSRNRIWMLQQHLEGNGVAARVSFRPEL